MVEQAATAPEHAGETPKKSGIVASFHVFESEASVIVDCWISEILDDKPGTTRHASFSRAFHRVGLAGGADEAVAVTLAETLRRHRESIDRGTAPPGEPLPEKLGILR